MAKSSTMPRKNSRAAPWATLVIGALAGLTLAVRPLGAGLIYERTLIMGGQVWRLWTGHLVHFGPGHLFWNLAVFVPVGCWLERLGPALMRWFYLVCPLVISAGLLAFDRSLVRYAGLSGVATGALVLLAGRLQSAESGQPVWVWTGVLGLVGAKIGLESFTGTPLLSGAGDFRAVPLAHLGGVVCASCAVVFQVRREVPPGAR
jgi:rhomboid family GlyGly-CTERM serine protease